jgi:hypothetical protein
MTSFAVRLQEIADRTNQRADMLVRNVVIDIATSLDERSPVGDPALWKHPASKDYQPGTFRGNWQLGIGVIPQGETGRIDPTGQETLSTIIASIPAQPAGTIIYLANNTPYARPIEDGHSTQAPNGVVGRTALEFQQYVDAAAAQVAA